MPGEEAIMMKAPRASAFSDSSNDQRNTALSGEREQTHANNLRPTTFVDFEIDNDDF